jgi:hypothetical protein
MTTHRFVYEHKDDMFAYRGDAPPDTIITVESRAAEWTELADLFLRYLLASGFYLTARDLSDYYAELSPEATDDPA